MIYEEIEFKILETKLIDYSKCSMTAESILMLWIEECHMYYINLEKIIFNYLKYADARKKLASMFQDGLFLFKTQERNNVCDIILHLLSFSNCNDICSESAVQNVAWYICKILKRYNYNYWELILRDIGQDETDVVRKIYNYLKKWENRIEAADTLHEYVINTIFETNDILEALHYIKLLESEDIFTKNDV